MIAYTMAEGRGDVDLLLFQLAQTQIAQGRRPVGTVQINTEREDACPCDMDVQVLPDEDVIRISQSLGPGAKGCRLDPTALEKAVGLVEVELAKGADCLIVNKFGKHEADGRGFRPVIAAALELGIPILVGLNQLNSAAFFEFADGLAVEIAPDPAALNDWMSAQIQSLSDAA